VDLVGAPWSEEEREKKSGEKGTIWRLIDDEPTFDV